MEIGSKKIWQQASGEGRNYSDVCLKWDIILNGPGESGPWPECIENWDRSSRKNTDLKRFCEEMQPGDLVVLRGGTSLVYGVGEVVGKYEWLHEFSDVDGWDLQHTRRVKWLWKGDFPEEFDTYDLKFGDTTQEINYQSPVVNWLKELEIPKANYAREIIPLPRLKKTECTGENEIAEYLYDKGVASNSIENLLKEFNELRRIASWYQGKEAPSESETVAYLVVPLLRALGWTPQKMAIEWRNVDLALFDKIPRHDDNLSVVVEAKKMGNSCLTAKSQAQSYVDGKPNCKRLIVTDGIRYGIYIQQENTFHLYAYMNLVELRDEYPIYKCLGIKEALRAMTPEWDENDMILEY
jgi:hypothetical protein